MIAPQFDIVAGFDPTAVATLTAEQLLQMVNQSVGLSNIGGVVIGSGAANAHPSVTNNPRFTKYIWLDTQTANAVALKIYQGTYPSDTYADWSGVTIPNNSIAAAQLADYAVSILNASGAKKIAYKQDGTADATKSNFLCRLDANGQYMEVVNASTVFGAMTVALSQLNVSGAADLQVLQYNAALNTPVWTTLSVSGLISNNSVAYSKLLNAGAPNYSWLLRANPTTGVIELVSNDNTVDSTLFPVRSIPINRIATPGAAYSKLRSDGTNWVITVPFYGAPTTGGTTLPAVTGGALSALHLLGAVPRRVGGFIICTSSEFGYAVGDIVNLHSLAKKGNGGEVRNAVALGSDSTTVFAIFNGDGGAGAAKGFYLPHKTTFAESQLTLASWNVFLFAEL